MYSGKFEKYNYGSSEANRKHYNLVCDGRGGEGRGVCDGMLMYIAGIARYCMHLIQ